MKLKNYIDSLNKLVEENPEVKEYDIVYSTDDEGNAFRKVECSPSVGNYDEYNKEFRNESDIDDLKVDYPDEVFEENAVCVN